jgi:hypothetical protein
VRVAGQQDAFADSEAGVMGREIHCVTIRLLAALVVGLAAASLVGLGADVPRRGSAVRPRRRHERRSREAASPE